MSDSPTPTLTTSVYEALRQDILRGMLQPGSKLAVEKLGRQFEAGGSPVREALNRLSSEGLVDRQDQRGFFVAGVGLEECRELVQTRCWLEAIAVREAIAHRSQAWEEVLVVAFHRLSRTPRSTDPEHFTANVEWEQLHGAFHEALIATCPSRWMLRFCRELREQADRYRQLAARHAFTRRAEGDEHRAILDAVLDGRADDAAGLLEAHYRTTFGIIQDLGATMFA